MGTAEAAGRRIGILGGTFDPVHFGHLFIAQEAADLFKLDRVLLVPCGDAPHKDLGHISPARHRLAMCELAVGDNPRLEVSHAELDRPGVSYAYDTIRHFLETVAPHDLHYIIGTDAFDLIHTWYRYPEILGLCRYVVIRRPGHIAKPRELLSDADVSRVDVLGVEVSSTDIRNRVGEGQSIRYLVPPAVEAYVLRHGLYRAREV